MLLDSVVAERQLLRDLSSCQTLINSLKHSQLSIGEFVDVRSRSFSIRYSPEQPIGIGSTEINPALQNLPDRHCAGVDLLWLTTREVESG